MGFEVVGLRVVWLRAFSFRAESLAFEGFKAHDLRFKV